MNNKEKYTNELKIALIGFTKCEDWIDFINCLNKVEKILNNNIENHMILLAPSLVKRLNQCLNPILSPSVHKSCLGIYKLFTKLPKESLIEQFPLLTVGLFEFSLDCKYLISEYYLKIIEEYIRIATNVDFERIQLSLFPFLEENLGEVTDSAKKLVKKLYQITDKQKFFYCLYKNFINYPAIRPSVIVFIKTYYNRKDIYDLLIKDDSCYNDKIVKLSVKSFTLAFKSNDSNLIKLSLELFSNIFNQKYPLMIFNYNNELVKYKISSEYKKLNNSLLVALIKVLLKRENILNNKVFEIFEEVKLITKLEDNIISDTLTIIFSEDVGVFIKLLHHFDNFNLILPTLLINLDKLNNDFITKKEDVKKIKEYIYNNSSEVYEIIVNNVIEIKYIEEILKLINNNKIYLIVKRILCNRKSFVKNVEDGIIFNRIFLSYLNNESIANEEFNLTSEVYNLKNYEESEFYEYDMINLLNYTKKFNVENINRDFREILNILFLSNYKYKILIDRFSNKKNEILAIIIRDYLKNDDSTYLIMYIEYAMGNLDSLILKILLYEILNEEECDDIINSMTVSLCDDIRNNLKRNEIVKQNNIKLNKLLCNGLKTNQLFIKILYYLFSNYYDIINYNDLILRVDNNINGILLELLNNNMYEILIDFLKNNENFINTLTTDNTFKELFIIYINEKLTNTGVRINSEFNISDINILSNNLFDDISIDPTSKTKTKNRSHIDNDVELLYKIVYIMDINNINVGSINLESVDYNNPNILKYTFFLNVNNFNINYYINYSTVLLSELKRLGNLYLFNTILFDDKIYSRIDLVLNIYKILLSNNIDFDTSLFYSKILDFIITQVSTTDLSKISLYELLSNNVLQSSAILDTPIIENDFKEDLIFKNNSNFISFIDNSVYDKNSNYINFLIFIYNTNTVIFKKELLLLDNKKLVTFFTYIEKYETNFNINLINVILLDINSLVLGVIYNGFYLNYDVLLKKFSATNNSLSDVFCLFRIVLYDTMDVTYIYKIYKIVEKAVIAYPQSDIFYYFYLFLLKYKKSSGKIFEFHNINLKDLESYYIFLYKISQDAKKHSLYEESQNISFDQINISKESLLSDSIISNTVKENEFKTKFFDNFVEHIGELNYLKKFTETKYKIFKNIYRMYDLDEMLERLFTELNPSYFRKNVVKRQNALKKIQFFILSCDHGTFDDFIDQLCTYIYEFLNDNDLVIETYNLISVLIYKVNNDSLKILYPIILEHIYKLKNLFELETNNNLNNNKIKTIFSLLKIIDVSVFTNSIEFKFYDVMKYFILENNIIKNQMNSNNVPLLCLIPNISIYKYLSVFSDYYERFFIDNDDADYETLDLFILKNLTE